MKEDHSFTIEPVSKPEEVKDTPVTEEVREVPALEEKQVEVKVEEKVEEKKEDKKKESKEPKKKINIGLIFLIVFVSVIAFVYIFLGQPTFIFHANATGDKFKVTFSKVEEWKDRKEEEELNNKKTEYYKFDTGFYISNKGAYILRNGNSISIQFGDDAKMYTATVYENEKDFYVVNEEKIPYVSEFAEYVDDNGKKISLEADYEGIIINYNNEYNVFLSYTENLLGYEGYYRGGNNYLLVYNTYDFAERLNQLKVYYYDGTTYGKLNVFEVNDVNADGVYDDITKDNLTTISGKLVDGSNSTFKLNIVNNNSIYNVSFVYNYTEDGITVNYDTLNGSYTK